MMATAQNFSHMLENYLNTLDKRPGELVKAKVIAITANEVVVDAGLKSEGYIPKNQFLNDDGKLEVAVGDQVEVVLDVLEDGFGETILSREKAKRVHAWRELEKDFNSGKVLTCRVTGRVRGGFAVDLGTLKGFLPGSLIDVRPVKDTSFIEGREIEVKIIKMDQKRNNIVVSRKAALEAGNEEERFALLSNLTEGQVIKGVIKNLTDYGAFVDLGGVDGLLHITDISWKRIRHPNEVLKVGQEVQVVVLKFDREKNRVSLGLKQISDDPWHEVAKRYPVGTRLSGKISNITDYGCFVEIENGVEGLVHVSEMDWTNKNPNPFKLVQVGDEVDVLVLEIDEERRRISLGMKQTKDNPWQAFSQKHEKGQKISGSIRSITDFGIFVGLEGNIDGLIHLSDISWDVPGEEAIRNYAKGQEIETVILAIDPERERISLGIKQLEANPAAEYLQNHPKGEIVTGNVVEIDEKRAVIELADGVRGVIRAADIAKGKVKDATEYLSMGETVSAMVMSADNKNRLINLSIKAIEEKTKGSDNRSTAPGATLGDILKEHLEGREEEQDS